jgi:hypothetical protein
MISRIQSLLRSFDLTMPSSTRPRRRADCSGSHLPGPVSFTMYAWWIRKKTHPSWLESGWRWWEIMFDWNTKWNNSTRNRNTYRMLSSKLRQRCVLVPENKTTAPRTSPVFYVSGQLWHFLSLFIFCRCFEIMKSCCAALFVLPADLCCCPLSKKSIFARNAMPRKSMVLIYHSAHSWIALTYPTVFWSQFIKDIGELPS